MKNKNTLSAILGCCAAAAVLAGAAFGIWKLISRKKSYDNQLAEPDYSEDFDLDTDPCDCGCCHNEEDKPAAKETEEKREDVNLNIHLDDAQ